MIDCRFFGAPSAVFSEAERRITLLPGKPLALLTYLACAPASSATRSRLVDLLWSDVDLDAGKHALRQTLWYIKRRLGDGVIVAENDHLTLTPGYHCDRTEFLRAIDAGEFERAVDLYTGPFFPDFAAPGGAEFERWADVERAHLCSKFVRAAEDVCRRLLHKGNTRTATALARRARDADLENESAWRLVIECLLASSDRIGAASEADALARKLQDDEREPEVATASLIRTARATDNGKTESPDTRATLFAELVGRESEFSRVISAWERTRAGQAAHIHITAPAGLGKTRLLSDIEARLRASRARVVRLRAAPGEQHMPYALAAELAASLAKLRGAAGVSPGAAASLVALNPMVSTWLSASPDTVVGEDGLRRRSLAIYELLSAVSTETPVVLLIDDLHWIDAESIQLLNSLTSRLQSLSTLLVTTSRPPSPFAADTALQMVQLLPLDASHVGAMLGSIAALPEEPWTETLPLELHGATGGSPLLVLELLQYALDHQRLAIESGAWRCANYDALIADMRPGRAVERRVAELDSAARTILLALAFVGVPVSSQLLASVVERSEHDVEATLARLEQTGLATRDGENWLPQHDEIAAAAQQAADETERRKMQRALAVALSQSAGAEVSTLKRALSHAVASSDDALLATSARRYVEHARKRGDARATAVVLRDGFGPDASRPFLRGVLSAFPIRERLPVARIARTAFAGLAGAFVIAACVDWYRDTRPIALDSLLIQTASERDTLVRELAILQSELEVDGEIPVDNSPLANRSLARVMELFDPVESPGRQEWTGWNDADVGGNVAPELVLQAVDGQWRRLASHRADDVGPSWLGDNRNVVFITRRFAEAAGRPAKDMDVAVVDVQSNSVRQLTDTPDNDKSPVISPDGTQLAFIREIASTGETQGCLSLLDGTDQQCTPIRGFNATGALRWRNNNEIILVATIVDGNLSALLRWSIRSGQFVTLHTGAFSYQVSPNGRDVVFDEQDPATALPRRYVAPVDYMSRRRLLKSRSGRILKTVWRASLQERTHVGQIKVAEQNLRVPVGTPLQVEAIASDDRGQTLYDAAIRFSSLDTNIATVDRRGTVLGKRIGEARILVTTGSALSDTAFVSITPVQATQTFVETWDSGLTDAWHSKGLPGASILAQSARDSVLRFPADSNYTSGVFTNRRFTAERGLALEVFASTPVDAAVWKALSISLRTLPDSSVVAAWKNADAGFPIEWQTLEFEAYCQMGLPAEEGVRGLHQMGLGASSEPARVNVGKEVSNGSWHRWLVQVFPDGRCGIAMDGQPLWISKRAIRRSRSLVALIDGRGVNTRILVDTVRVWEGMAPGVNWAAYPMARNASKGN